MRAPNSSSGIALRANDHHVGGMDRRLSLDDPSLWILLRRPSVSFNDINPFDDHPVRFGIDLKNLAATSAVVSGDHKSHIVFMNMHQITSQFEKSRFRKQTFSCMRTGCPLSGALSVTISKLFQFTLHFSIFNLRFDIRTTSPNLY